jgi:hypothetical protein
MRLRQTFFLLHFIIAFCSCSKIQLKNRARNTDTKLTLRSSYILKGAYSNFPSDSTKSTLYQQFKKAFTRNSLNGQNPTVDLNPIDKRTIGLSLKDKNVTTDSIVIKGRYRKGYFKTRRHWETSFIAGPFLWTIGDNFKYLGLTAERNLVILNSDAGGLMLMLLIPIFGTNSGQP